VLVVDDDAGVRGVCTTLLHVLGYRAHEVHSGEQALETLSREDKNVRLVLLDLQMPEMDGERVLHELREKHPSLRVLLMSGRARGDLTHYLEAGASAVLKKPFGLSELDSSVENALGA
jgi:CheY-like chemotaxis protein